MIELPIYDKIWHKWQLWWRLYYRRKLWVFLGRSFLYTRNTSLATLWQLLNKKCWCSHHWLILKTHYFLWQCLQLPLLSHITRACVQLSFHPLREIYVDWYILIFYCFLILETLLCLTRRCSDWFHFYYLTLNYVILGYLFAALFDLLICFCFFIIAHFLIFYFLFFLLYLHLSVLLSRQSFCLFLCDFHFCPAFLLEILFITMFYELFINIHSFLTLAWIDDLKTSEVVFLIFLTFFLIFFY